MTWLKWLGITLSLATLGLAGFVAYAHFIGNPRVIAELKSDPLGNRAGIVMLLTFPDGRTLPVNYLRDGNQVFAGADGLWWRALRAGDVPVTVEIRGEVLAGRARVVLDDPEYTRPLFKRLRPKVPKWLPQWLDAYLVAIDLDRTAKE